MFDFRVVYLPPDTPLCFKGLTAKDADDFYTILINPNLSYDEQREVFEHEYAHIKLNHFYDDRPIREKEDEAEKRRFPLRQFSVG